LKSLRDLSNFSQDSSRDFTRIFKNIKRKRIPPFQSMMRAEFTLLITLLTSKTLRISSETTSLPWKSAKINKQPSLTVPRVRRYQTRPM
jgi:hypothetical protein